MEHLGYFLAVENVLACARFHIFTDEDVYVYQNPILTGREPDATDEARALSIERSAELSEKVNQVSAQYLFSKISP